MEDYASAIIEESFLNDKWAGENIETTLAALRPYLEYRQHIARTSHRIDFDLILPIYKQCNKQISEILSLPKSKSKSK